MKISTFFTTALLATAQVAYSIPAPHPGPDDPIAEPAQFLPIEGRDIHDGPIVRGAGYHQERHLQRRNVNNQRITGVRVGYSGAYRVYRQEIRKFRNDRGGRVHDLFLLALIRMYSRPASDVNSYWQLAGIHGRPFQGWAGDSASSWNNNGYCTHGSTLFPTWHRPYLAYFEEVVWANAEAVINEQVRWQDREEWRAALMVLRLPYYDFGYDAYLPDVFRDPNWTLRLAPNGQRNTVRISNPLYSAKLAGKPYNTAFGSPFNGWDRTRRAPTSNTASTPEGSDNNRVLAGLVQNRASLRQRVYQLLMNNRSWNTFSNRASGANGGQAYDSLESIHDTIHGLLGLNGHMSYVEYSAFDPIFFIHHCNVDRLFAMWQAIYPTTYVTPQVNRGGTYGVRPGTTEYRTSILRPFRGLSGGYWTSDGVRDTSLFGYGYYETPKWKYSKATENEYSNVVRRTVQDLYGRSDFSSKRKRDLGNSTEAALDASLIGNKYYEWRIDVVADKSEGNGTYYVYFFLGRPSRNPTEWNSQPELAGTYVVFTHDHQVAPGIDPATIDNTVTGSVPLTDAMIKAFPDTDLNSLKPQDAIPFLIKNLRWRATDHAGKPIRIRKLKGLKVSVSINLVSLPVPGREWSEFSEWEHLTEITRRIGRDGGPDRINVVPDLSSPAAPTST